MGPSLGVNRTTIRGQLFPVMRPGATPPEPLANRGRINDGVENENVTGQGRRVADTSFQRSYPPPAYVLADGLIGLALD